MRSSQIDSSRMKDLMLLASRLARISGLTEWTTSGKGISIRRLSTGRQDCSGGGQRYVG
jgi:hypothetical protein